MKIRYFEHNLSREEHMIQRGQRLEMAPILLPVIYRLKLSTTQNSTDFSCLASVRDDVDLKIFQRKNHLLEESFYRAAVGQRKEARRQRARKGHRRLLCLVVHQDRLCWCACCLLAGGGLRFCAALNDTVSLSVLE